MNQPESNTSPGDSVDFYFDVACPWCWITSRWMMEVATMRSITINWKFFSLQKINEGRQDTHKASHVAGHRALRVAAAIRKEHGNDGVGTFYTVAGTRRHHDQKDIGEPDTLKEILEACGLPPELAAACDDAAWDEIIEADMQHAIAKAGTDVGVPQIVLDGGAGPGFFGPVLSPAPTGEAALALWDAMVVAGRTPGFYEFKRSRETGPLLGERPHF